MRRIIVLLRGNINLDCRVQKEIDTFISLGFKVTLITWNFEEIFYKKEDLEIINFNFGKHKNPYGKLFTFFNIFRFWYYASKVIKKETYEYIHCNDLDTLGIVYFLPKQNHKRIIYDAHELFPERHTTNSIQYKIWNLIEKQIIKKVGKIICPEPNRASYLKHKYQLHSKIYVVNNFPNYRTIKPKNLRERLNIPKGAIILNYLGALVPNREIEVTIEALKYLPENYVFVLIGYAFDDDYKIELRRCIEVAGLTNRVFFYGSVLPKEVLQTIAGCNIGIALYRNTNINNFYCAPNKVFDYIMAGVKVIANAYPSLFMLDEYRFVRLISEVSPKSIAKCAIDLANEKSQVQHIVKRRFCWESFNEVLSEIYS